MVRGTDANAQAVQFLFFFVSYSLSSPSVKMKLIFCCCVFTLLLGINTSAGIIHEIIIEKNPVTLSCPGSVEGTVTWSRDTNGVTTFIMTVYNDVETKHISDPYKYYSSLADKSLQILKVQLSDSGRFFCNSEAVVDLTVIPSGIKILHTKRNTVSLTCPPDVGGSDDPVWSTDAGEIPTQGRIWTSDKSLIITELQRSDSGLYYCDGKPALYLNVIREDQSDGAPSTAAPSTAAPSTAAPSTAAPSTAAPSTAAPSTAAPSITTTTLFTTPINDPTTTKKQKHKKSRKEKDKNRKKTTPTTSTTTSTPIQTMSATPPEVVYGIAAGSLLFIIINIIITIVTIFACLKRRRSKKTVKEEDSPVYYEIQDGLFLFQPKQDCLTQNDPTYSTIPDLPLMGKTNDTDRQDESPYSCIQDIPTRGNNDGFLQTAEGHYFLLQQPKTSENNDKLTSV